MKKLLFLTCLTFIILHTNCYGSSDSDSDDDKWEDIFNENWRTDFNKDWLGVEKDNNETTLIQLDSPISTINSSHEQLTTNDDNNISLVTQCSQYLPQKDTSQTSQQKKITILQSRSKSLNSLLKTYSIITEENAPTKLARRHSFDQLPKFATKTFKPSQEQIALIHQASSVSKAASMETQQKDISPKPCDGTTTVSNRTEIRHRKHSYQTHNLIDGTGKNRKSNLIITDQPEKMQNFSGDGERNPLLPQETVRQNESEKFFNNIHFIISFFCGF